MCRLRLTGTASGVEAACAGLGEALNLAVPRGGVAASVLGVAPALPGAEPFAADASVGEFVAARCRRSSGRCCWGPLP